MHITFSPPIKGKFCDTEDDEEILGLLKYFDSYLVIHKSGYTAIKWLRAEVRVEIEKRLKEQNGSNTTVSNNPDPNSHHVDSEPASL